MKRYCLGIAVTETHIVMIRKKRPEWQAGKLNFIGGKLEEDEDSIDAMVREFREETGVETFPHQWKYLGDLGRYLGDDKFRVAVYYAEDEKFDACRTIEDEEIVLYDKQTFLLETLESQYSTDKFMPNLHWLYLFSQSADNQKYDCIFDILYPSITTGQKHHD